MRKAGLSLIRYQKSTDPSDVWTLLNSSFLMNNPLLIFFHVRAYKASIALYAQIKKISKVDYSSKAKSFNVRDFLLPIGTVNLYTISGSRKQSMPWILASMIHNGQRTRMQLASQKEITIFSERGAFPAGYSHTKTILH